MNIPFFTLTFCFVSLVPNNKGVAQWEVTWVSSESLLAGASPWQLGVGEQKRKNKMLVPFHPACTIPFNSSAMSFVFPHLLEWSLHGEPEMHEHHHALRQRSNWSVSPPHHSGGQPPNVCPLCMHVVD